MANLLVINSSAAREDSVSRVLIEEALPRLMCEQWIKKNKGATKWTRLAANKKIVNLPKTISLPRPLDANMVQELSPMLEIMEKGEYYLYNTSVRLGGPYGPRGGEEQPQEGEARPHPPTLRPNRPGGPRQTRWRRRTRPGCTSPQCSDSGGPDRSEPRRRPATRYPSSASSAQTKIAIVVFEHPPFALAIDTTAMMPPYLKVCSHRSN